MAGIAAVGHYLPRYKITAEAYALGTGGFSPSGFSEKSVPGYDEDEITMAVAAGERALAVRREEVSTLAFASSSAISGVEVVRDALGLEHARTREMVGDRTAGIKAVLDAIIRAESEQQTTLVVVSDAHRATPFSPQADWPLGGAAVSLLITPSGGLRRLRGIDYIAHGARQEVILGPATVMERRIGTVDAISAILSFFYTLRVAKVGELLDLEGLMTFEVGEHPPGNPDWDAELQSRVPVTYDQYIGMRRYKSTPPGTEYSQGAYVSMSAYLGETKARYRLVGEECAKCGRLHFPPRESCLACGTRVWKERPLKRTGAVYAYTIISKGAAPSEFLEQQLATGDYATAVVELDDGLRITAMLADVEPASVKIGRRVRMVFRRLYAQEGVIRYGFKFAPG